jgi:hypothetical protein
VLQFLSTSLRDFLTRASTTPINYTNNKLALPVATYWNIIAQELPVTSCHSQLDLGGINQNIQQCIRAIVVALQYPKNSIRSKRTTSFCYLILRLVTNKRTREQQEQRLRKSHHFQIWRKSSVVPRLYVYYASDWPLLYLLAYHRNCCRPLRSTSDAALC